MTLASVPQPKGHSIRVREVFGTHLRHGHEMVCSEDSSEAPTQTKVAIITRSDDGYLKGTLKLDSFTTTFANEGVHTPYPTRTATGFLLAYSGFSNCGAISLMRTAFVSGSFSFRSWIRKSPGRLREWSYPVGSSAFETSTSPGSSVRVLSGSGKPIVSAGNSLKSGPSP